MVAERRPDHRIGRAFDYVILALIVLSVASVLVEAAENYLVAAQNAGFPTKSCTNNINCAMNEIDVVLEADQRQRHRRRDDYQFCGMRRTCRAKNK